jgi:predicted RNA methylase
MSSKPQQSKKDRARPGPGKDPGRKPNRRKAAAKAAARGGGPAQAAKAGGPKAGRPRAAGGAKAAGRAKAAQPAAWVVRSAPGLGRTLLAELRHDKLLGQNDRADLLWQRNHDLLFAPRLARMPQTHELRVAEDVHRCLVYGRYKVSDSQLDRLAELLHGQRRRMVVTADGRHFNRHDLARFMGRELAARGVKLDDSAKAPLLVFCIEQAYYACVPLRDADATAGRDRRQVEREGSLPPPIAAAMAFMTRPADDDTILDPVCGSGTLLAEAAGYAPTARLLGTDQDLQAVKTARRNLNSFAAAEIDHADARALDLPDESVSLVLANLPFGKQYGDVAENRTLYTEVLREIRRVAAPRGFRAAVLVSDRALLRESAREAGLRVSHDTAIRVRGEDATIVLLERPPEG